MPAITLPDKSVRRFDGPVTGATVAAEIGPGLARAALAMKLNGKLVDLETEIDHDAELVFVTRRDPDALGLIRHDAAHVLAEAVQELYPGTQVTIGPAIADGFYYDFARNQPFTPDDFAPIEAKMREIVGRGEKFVRQVIDREEAIQFFQDKGEKYKAEIIQDLPRDETITLYRQGNWVDLCRGPHMRSTADVGGAFKLMKVAGAYWRGDHRNAMLSRIYGTAWRDQKELDGYLHMLEEAERRDHRRIGKEMDLFHLQEEAAGSVFWHPKGWKLYLTSEAYMRRRLDAAGYQEVKTPQLLDRSFWERSGHWEKFRQHMFIAHVEDEAKTSGAEADELPLPHPDLPPGPAVVPRVAVAPGGIRVVPSLRTLGRAAWHHAGARVHPGRCAHLLHRAADRPGDGAVRRVAVLDLPGLRLSRVQREVLRPAGTAGG